MDDVDKSGLADGAVMTYSATLNKLVFTMPDPQQLQMKKCHTLRELILLPTMSFIKPKRLWVQQNQVQYGEYEK